MNLLWKYLIESGLSLCLFYGIYWTFLRRDTFFSRNRFYLTLTIITSMIIPLLSISIRQPTPLYSFEVLLDEAVIIPTTSSYDYSGFSLQNLLIWIYWAGVSFFFTKFLFHTGQILWLIRSYGITRENGIRIVYLEKNISPFSFYNIIFLNRSLIENDYREKIIAHEKNHIRNRHTLDLIIFEVLTVIQWFNPVAWLYKWSLKEVHEFQADEAVIREGHDTLNYQELIISQVFGNQFFRVAHNLNKSLIKKRIIMMTRFKSSKIARYKIFLVIPIALFTLVLFSFSGNPPEPVTRINTPAFNDNLFPAIQDTAVYFNVDTMPKFQGGDVTRFRKYLAMNLSYPKEARDKNISGKVYVQFIVTEQGKVNKVQVIRGVDPLLDKEALRVVLSSPDWEPGIKDGKKVNVAFTFPVSFVLDEEKGQPKPEIPSVDPNNPDVYFLVEEMPTFQDGDAGDFRKYIADNLKYPKEALEKGISGKVFVQFLVNKEGEIEDVKVVRGVDPLLDKEAVRVVSNSPSWKPGKQDGETVKVAYTFPIVFTLAEKKKETQKTNDPEVEGEVFFVVEEMPKFQGSDDITKFKNHIAENLKYPQEAKKNKIEGRVFVQFIINEDGKLGNVKIVRGVNPLLDKEAFRVLSNSDPDWEPGKQRGKKVNVAYTIPIVFKLSEVPLKNTQDETVVVGLKSKVSDNALYLIDGKIVSHDIFKTLNPDHIESVEVIKGEKAEQLYGTKAKNGAVAVTMKSGEDKPDGLTFRVTGLQTEKDILFLIDDKPATMEKVKLLNAADIQSIEVIKGENAINEYGKKAKEGVVKITMK